MKSFECKKYVEHKKGIIYCYGPNLSKFNRSLKRQKQNFEKLGVILRNFNTNLTCCSVSVEKFSRNLHV